MMYYSTGATHAPHHVFEEWADKYRGQFDEGWDVYRRKTFERQKELGIIPPDTELTERPDLFPAWDSLSENQKKLYARQMEVFAGFSENADWNVGRLLDAIEDLGESDNTLVFYIWGDNGASMEGTITGSFNEMTFFNGLLLDAERQLELIEQYGGIEALGDEHSAPHFASAWAHANNTPFQWGKQMASHLGGARDPMVVAWPTRIRPDSQVRSQFTHCIDIAPTVLEAIGLPEPTSVDGIEQEPMDGTSFAAHLRRGGGRRAPHGAVLRNVRQPRHLQRRVVGLRSTGQGAVGLLTGDTAAVRARKVRPRQRRLGAVLPTRRLLPGQEPGRRAS